MSISEELAAGRAEFDALMDRLASNMQDKKAQQEFAGACQQPRQPVGPAAVIRTGCDSLGGRVSKWRSTRFFEAIDDDESPRFALPALKEAGTSALNQMEYLLLGMAVSAKRLPHELLDLYNN
jgi:hypothetical protein